MSYLPPAKCLPPVYLGPYSGAEAIAIGFSTALWGEFPSNRDSHFRWAHPNLPLQERVACKCMLRDLVISLRPDLILTKLYIYNGFLGSCTLPCAYPHCAYHMITVHIFLSAASMINHCFERRCDILGRCISLIRANVSPMLGDLDVVRICLHWPVDISRSSLHFRLMTTANELALLAGCS